jgi:CheY-like chemotaxis protein
VQPGRFLQLGVTDTGCGIRRENLERIFEPFFTTKGPGFGTGLGLANVFRIVAQHHGWLEVDSEINVGTAFRIFLPALDGQVSEDARVASGAEAGKGERILVVEDDASVRSLVRAVLERYGYRVFEAATAAAARQIWQEQLGHFDLLFTDLILPGRMSGSELAELLQLAKPDLRVVYTSGYGGEIVAENLSVEASQGLLKKPFSAGQLAAAVRKSLDERSNHPP